MKIYTITLCFLALLSNVAANSFTDGLAYGFISNKVEKTYNKIKTSNDDWYEKHFAICPVPDTNPFTKENLGLNPAPTCPAELPTSVLVKCIISLIVPGCVLLLVKSKDFREFFMGYMMVSFIEIICNVAVISFNKN